MPEQTKDTASTVADALRRLNQCGVEVERPYGDWLHCHGEGEQFWWGYKTRDKRAIVCGYYEAHDAILRTCVEELLNSDSTKAELAWVSLYHTPETHPARTFLTAAVDAVCRLRGAK